MKFGLSVCLVLSVSSISSVCSAQEGTASIPPAGSSAHNVIKMKTSWYKAGNITACGQKFDPNDPTIAAHKVLPCGTVLKVINPMNGRYLRMTVQDNGPHVKGRALDVSLEAAKKLGFVDKGVTDLEVEVVSVP